MDYFLSLTIPPNTTPEHEEVIAVDVPMGWVKQVRITIPWGVAGLAGVRILANTAQIYPANLGAYYTGNDNTLIINDNLHLTDTFTTIEVCGYNADDTFPHTIYVGLTIEPEEAEATPTQLGIWQLGWEEI